MGTIVYFDICALFVVLLLLITTVARKMTRGKQNRYFLFFILITLITVTADVAAILLDQAGPGNRFAKQIAHTVYLFAHLSTTPVYLAYLLTMTDIWHRLHRHTFLMTLLFTPDLLGVLLILSNPFTNWVFYLDENDAYTRGILFPLLYAAAAVYLITGIIHMLHYRKQFSPIQFCVLFSGFPVAILAAIVQFFYPDYVIELFANSMLLVLISELVQRPENLLDPDTGLLKLSAYVTNVRNASNTSKRMEIIMLNITNYPVIRDLLGYRDFNKVLRQVSDELLLLNRHRHAKAEFYYLGQGKFRMVLDSDHFHMTSDLAEKIFRAMRPGFPYQHMTINLVCHVCITRYPEDIDNVDSLLAFGNDLNSIPFTGAVMYACDHYHKKYYDIQKNIDRIIEEALASHSFEVYYQPIYSVMEQRFNSAEALLRLKTEKYGFIPPDVFIPAAEKSGAIHMLGNFVINEVCKFISSEEFKKLNVDYIEVNLSVVQCMQQNLAAEILSTIDRYQVRPEQLNLEITETSASYSQKTMVENLRILTDAGISFALDDFGTGYSNMQRIATLPLNIVKLDKSFISIEDNSNLMIVLENTIHMIKDMNMKIVVEGVETENMVEQFTRLKCEYIQGYFYSKPIPREEFIQFIQQNTGNPLS